MICRRQSCYLTMKLWLNCQLHNFHPNTLYPSSSLFSFYHFTSFSPLSSAALKERMREVVYDENSQQIVLNVIDAHSRFFNAIKLECVSTFFLPFFLYSSCFVLQTFLSCSAFFRLTTSSKETNFPYPRLLLIRSITWRERKRKLRKWFQSKQNRAPILHRLFSSFLKRSFLTSLTSMDEENSDKGNQMFLAELFSLPFN